MLVIFNNKFNQQGEIPAQIYKNNEHILQVCTERIFGKMRREARKNYELAKKLWGEDL